MRWRLNWIDRVVSNEPAPPMERGQIYEVHVSAWNTSYVFNRGHQIRVSVSSSNEPRFSANLNIGVPLAVGGTPLVAENTIHFSASHPSHFELPIVPLSELPPSDVVNRLSVEAVGDDVIDGAIRGALAKQRTLAKMAGTLALVEA